LRGVQIIFVGNRVLIPSSQTWDFTSKHLTAQTVYLRLQFLQNRTIAGNAISLTQFLPLRFDHLRFVNILLKTFCTQGVCFAFLGRYPAYIEGMFHKYYNVKHTLGQFSIAKKLRFNGQTLQKTLSFRNRSFPVPYIRRTRVWKFSGLFSLWNYTWKFDTSFSN